MNNNELDPDGPNNRTRDISRAVGAAAGAIILLMLLALLAAGVVWAWMAVL